jgi:uncharacterized membrane protein YhhN
MKSKKLILQLIFWIIVLADIFGLALDISMLHYIAKPFLLPALFVLVVVNTPAGTEKKILLAALFFSWLGDMFLLFENKNSLFFIFGLASFLITHILYIIYFLRQRSNKISLLKKQPFFFAAVLVYGISLVWLLFPHLKSLKFPVVVYAAVICAMMLCSLHIFYKVKKAASALFVTGALLFVISDSLLAVNKFYAPFTLAGVYIMLTYCAAQYFIVKGFIKQQTND